MSDKHRHLNRGGGIGSKGTGSCRGSITLNYEYEESPLVSEYIIIGSQFPIRWIFALNLKIDLLWGGGRKYRSTGNPYVNLC